MNYKNEIENRISRRNYIETPIESEKVEVLRKLIEELNEKSGLSIKFIEDASDAFSGFRKSYGMLKGVHSVILLQGDVSDANLKEKCGYFGEIVVLEAIKLGLGTCWVGGSFEKGNKAFIDEVTSIKPVCVITIGNVPENKSAREKLIYKLTHRKSKSAYEMYKSDITPPDWFLSGMDAVAKAPTAANSQKVFFELLADGDVKASVPGNSEFDLVDLGICKLHFELGSGKKL
jgi:hypothetical protein